MEGRVLKLAPGSIVAARYRIEDRIGEGGMAVVYRAHHVGTDSPCALKFIHPRLLSETDLLDQFLNEARIAAKIGAHPHIVTVFDTGLDGNLGIPFIAMELLTGQPLRRLILKRAPLPWEIAAGLLLQLADALDEAHAAGIVHRDLKPSNVFVTEDRRGRLSVKVLDFGIAKVLDGAGDNTATEVGTPWYNAPEQLGSKMRSLAAGHGIAIAPQVSPATDVWALGLMTYELLTGLRIKSYWGANTVTDQMLKVALDPRDPPSAKAGDRIHTLPAGFDGWFLRCLSHDASQRFQAAGEAVEQLAQLLGVGPRPSDATLTPAAALDTSAGSIPTVAGASSPAPPQPTALGPAAAPTAAATDLETATEPIDTMQTWQATLGRTKPATKAALAAGLVAVLLGAVGGLALLWQNGDDAAPGAQVEPAATTDLTSGSRGEPTVAGASTEAANREAADAGAAEPTASASAAAAPTKRTSPRRPRPRPAKPRPAPTDPFGRSQR
ncbi:MAG: serine/threonine protein kinase [Deltaproteobacteria bacterium]|jgi:serine/threonine-protein kinase|nr:serine/threonine protein kinase [Deltaproteobacteria bacterium]MBW2530425.1 serine/threonine protein kinase [Deltaproteobacteria bacterium]